MANVIYPCAEVIKGDFCNKYIYFEPHGSALYIREESVYKDGFFSMGLWYNALYTFTSHDVLEYEDLSNASYGNSASNIFKAGVILGTCGAIAASANNGTAFDTAIYFKNGKKCIVRFTEAQYHQKFISLFYNLDEAPSQRKLEKNDTNEVNPYEELKQLKELLDLGVVSQEEFEIKKKQLLNL